MMLYQQCMMASFLVTCPDASINRSCCFAGKRS
jgi:hypothetical protein